MHKPMLDTGDYIVYSIALGYLYLVYVDIKNGD